MATVTIRKLTPTEAVDSFQPTHLWHQRAEDLIEGRSQGFELTFGGAPEDQEKAIDSAIVCLNRYRKRAALAGRFKDHIFVIQRRGSKLWVWNVPIELAPKNWKGYKKWMVKSGKE